MTMLKLEEAPDTMLWDFSLSAGVPAEVMGFLASHKNPGIRCNLAGHRDLPPHLVELLVNDPDSGVRWRMADRHDLPPHLVEKLANDPEERVRRHVEARGKDNLALKFMMGSWWVVYDRRPGD